MSRISVSAGHYIDMVLWTGRYPQMLKPHKIARVTIITWRPLLTAPRFARARADAGAPSGGRGHCQSCRALDVAVFGLLMCTPPPLGHRSGVPYPSPSLLLPVPALPFPPILLPPAPLVRRVIGRITGSLRVAHLAVEVAGAARPWRRGICRSVSNIRRSVRR